MNLKIEKMTLSDLEEIKDSLSEEFDDFWNYNILKEELESSNSRYIVAKVISDVLSEKVQQENEKTKSKNQKSQDQESREIVGFAGIKIFLDEADIMNIVTKKKYRNRGIGFKLLEQLLTLSKELKLKALNLEVNEKNKTAIHLYEKAGFQNIAVRKNYYKNNSAIIMKCLIGDCPQ